MADRPSFDDEVARLSVLADDVRRRLYRFVVEQGRPVGRDEAAAGVGVARHTAKFHLDRLEEEGLLEAEFRRLTDKTGPGAGRPAKLYRRSATEVSVSVPERRYAVLGEVLAEAVDDATRAGTPVADAVAAAAREAGHRLGAAEVAGGGIGDPRGPGALAEILRRAGYEPYRQGDVLCLRNCPFDSLARAHTELVCGVNLDFLTGLLEELGLASLKARLDPGEGRCCVTVAARS